jgi:hypothetical protein
MPAYDAITVAVCRQVCSTPFGLVVTDSAHSAAGQWSRAWVKEPSRRATTRATKRMWHN